MQQSFQSGLVRGLVRRLVTRRVMEMRMRRLMMAELLRMIMTRRKRRRTMMRRRSNHLSLKLLCSNLSHYNLYMYNNVSNFFVRTGFPCICDSLLIKRKVKGSNDLGVHLNFCYRKKKFFIACHVTCHIIQPTPTVSCLMCIMCLRIPYLW